MGTTSPTFLARIFESTLARYATALAAILVALLVRGALSPFVGDYVPFITLFPAVIFAAWFCGIGPSILKCFCGPTWSKAPVRPACALIQRS